MRLGKKLFFNFFKYKIKKLTYECMSFAKHLHHINRRNLCMDNRLWLIDSVHPQKHIEHIENIKYV